MTASAYQSSRAVQLDHIVSESGRTSLTTYARIPDYNAAPIDAPKPIPRAPVKQALTDSDITPLEFTVLPDGSLIAADMLKSYPKQALNREAIGIGVIKLRGGNRQKYYVRTRCLDCDHVCWIHPSSYKGNPCGKCRAHDMRGHNSGGDPQRFKDANRALARERLAIPAPVGRCR